VSATGSLADAAAARLKREAARSARRRAANPSAFARELREECGVFGVIGTSDAAALTALGLHALQHRGQEGAGIACYDPAEEVFHNARRLGLVADNFSSAALLKSLVGDAAIGHTRYSTQGDTVERNVQPLYADLDRTGVAIAHNGNLTNARALKLELIREGCIFQSTSDSELFLQLTARSRAGGIVDKLIDSFKAVEGAYALAVLTNDALIGARDPVGIRPLVLGRIEGAHILASETCALDLIGAKFVRDVEPGEMVICRPGGTIESRQFAPRPARPRPCIFELIYFARPDSIVDGKSVYEIRKRLGARLAKDAPAEADFVAPIPDSGVPAAIGYAQASGVPYEMALIRSHFVGRTFIEPQQKIREAGVRRKHAPNRDILKGRRVVLIDDSIVRGTTSRKIVDMVRSAGAREVHLRVACPPIAHPDYYGINTPSYDELLAHDRSVEEMRDMLGVDSLAFLKVDSLYEAIERRPRDASAPAFTDHCFTGDYPTPRTDIAMAKQMATVEQLSFLAETGPA
jgi:amidophosphoribosyltransferase